MSEPIAPHMSAAKIKVLTDSFARARHYLEYGVGGSTLLAAQSSLQSIKAIDSHRDWIEKVNASILSASHTGDIRLILVELGKTSDWGYPADESMIKSWPLYYTTPWTTYTEQDISPDLILIDGRFRVACFLHSLLQCKPGTRILWDDYRDRVEYHAIEQVLRPIGLVDDMAIFSVSADFNRALALRVLFEHLFNPD